MSEYSAPDDIVEYLVQIIQNPNVLRTHGAETASIEAAELLLSASSEPERRKIALDFLRKIASGDGAGTSTNRVRACRALILTGDA